VGACSLRRDGGYWRLQAPADGVGDVPDRHVLFSDCMIPGSCSVLFQSEPVETGNVEDMRRPLKSAREAVNFLLK